jgi:hypothetical protein
MQRIATIMAQGSMIPEALYMSGNKDNRKELPLPAVISNCFLIVNQSVRWGMDPFGVAQCVSLVRGKICYEGKLIAAVLDAKLGVHLIPEYDGGPGETLGVTIYAYDDEDNVIVNPRTKQPLTVSGTVADWRTVGNDSAWAQSKNHKRMLMYRGSREWARIYRPAIMLGVYVDDEMDEMGSRARDVTPTRRAPPPPPPVAEIEHKQIAEVQHVEQTQDATAPKRQFPPPPPVDAAEPTIAWTDVIADYKDAAEAAKDVDELDAAFGNFISPYENKMPRNVYEMAAAIDDKERGRIE